MLRQEEIAFVTPSVDSSFSKPQEVLERHFHPNVTSVRPT